MLKGMSSEKIIVGYDLGEDSVQISYCNLTENREPETLSAVAGTEQYDIPLVLCKRLRVNQWYYGNEALRYEKESGGILVKDLLKLALDGETVRIEDTEYDPVALLTLFFRRSLGALTPVASVDNIEALMITSDPMDQTMVSVLERVAANLRIRTDKIVFQSHQESYYYYMLNQPGELWKEPSVLFDYRGDRMGFFRMECNRRTQPVVVFIHQEQEAFPDGAALEGQENRAEVLDEAFLSLTREKIGDGRVGSVYLIGEGFEECWLKKSLRFLHSGRRIFLGNNLFSKGACYGMLEQFFPREQSGKYVFLGEDKLKSNIGMWINRRGEECYIPLLDAGKRWMKIEAELEFYLREENRVELTVTSLTGAGKQIYPLELDHLSGEIARIHMKLYVQDEDRLIVELEDLGFGEYRPTEHRRWKHEIKLI